MYMKQKNSYGRSDAYESPIMEIYDLQVEGLLCVSDVTTSGGISDVPEEDWGIIY